LARRRTKLRLIPRSVAFAAAPINPSFNGLQFAPCFPLFQAPQSLTIAKRLFFCAVVVAAQR
jgi:hypothetical protein